MNEATREAASRDNIAAFFLAEKADTPEEREAILALSRSTNRDAHSDGNDVLAGVHEERDQTISS